MDASPPMDEQCRRNFILASALLHAPPPVDRIYANCARVLRHALMAAGLWDHQRMIDGQIHAFHGDVEQFPIIALWYSTLIGMTREPEASRLLNGAGNLDLPAGAYFTACWLTAKGRVAAEGLLAEHPDWEARLTKRPDE
jgi:hypothetical protein